MVRCATLLRSELTGTRLIRRVWLRSCQRYGIAELAVFGSIARGDASPDSDIDLFYVLAPGARLGFGIDDLEDELAGLFGRDVDLVAKKAVHPLLRNEVDELTTTLYAA